MFQESDNNSEARKIFLEKQLLLETSKTAFQQMSGLLKNGTLYPELHPYLLSLAEKMMMTIDELMAGRKEVAFHFVQGELFFETHSVPMDETTSALIEQFTGRDIGGIVFKPGITAAELIKLAVLISRESTIFKPDGSLVEAVSPESVAHIDFHRSVMIVDKKSDDDKAQQQDEKKAAEIFMDLIEAIKEVVNNIQMNKPIDIRRINTRIQFMVDKIEHYRNALFALTAVKMCDEYTYAHLVNTCFLSILFADFLSFERKRIIQMGVSALLHDIGKSLVLPDIMNKPDNLTEEEWELVERHPIDGALILSGIPGATKLAFITAFEHHQHGTKGYPKRHDHFPPLLSSQIISLADAYDVLTSSRIYYKMHMPHQEIMKILLKKSGVDFNAALVKSFLKMIGIFPVGTLVSLSGGEIGLVTEQSTDPLRPKVLLLKKDTDSGKENKEEICLSEKSDGQYKYEIVGTINPQGAKIDVKSYFQ